MTDNSKITRRRYLKYASAGILAGAAAVASGGFHSYQSNQEEANREFNRSLYPPQKLRVGSKGIIYSVGGYGTSNSRSFSWDEKRDIETIHDVLGCDGIRIYGSSESKIIECARMAAEKDFETILLLPFYIDATRDELMKNLREFAKEAEKVRKDYGDKVILMPGNELSCTSKGILPGDTYLDRCNAINEHQNDEDVKKKLLQLLNDLISVSRDGFDGQLCYGAGSWEWWLPWDELDLDILGDQHYWYKQYGDPEDSNNAWFEHVRHYKRYGKRYFLAEYECSP